MKRQDFGVAADGGLDGAVSLRCEFGRGFLGGSVCSEFGVFSRGFVSWIQKALAALVKRDPLTRRSEASSSGRDVVRIDVHSTLRLPIDS